MRRPTIALAMIVKNEEENISRLLKSVEGCFDEIHITDTGSTDKTVEICKSFGATVHHFEWVNDFSAARNASFDPVTTDFVMWLDADDALENKEGFLLFRNTVMNIGDYHVAPYHYSSDAQGNPTCTFARERVFRVNRGMRWKYPIHEGVLPVSEYGQVRVNYSPAWAVRHMRTESDIQKDRFRNLGVFESYQKQNKLDARLKYYYGKELFEANQPIEAIRVLGEATSDRALEHHDRILAHQYLCYAYMQCNQFQKALEIANTAVLLDPQRAEFFNIAGDCLLKMNRIEDSVPFYSAAKGCKASADNNFAGPIFKHFESYTSFPRNQIARVAAATGDLDKAEKEAKEAADLYNHHESVAILAEIRKLKLSIHSFSKAKDCGDIVFTTAPQTAYEFDPGIANEKAMGGSETALIEMAKNLKALSDRRVIVFNMRQTDGVFDGVEYISNGKVHEYFKEHRPYFHVAWRHNLKLTDAPTFVWCHDLQTPGLEHTGQYVKAMALTPFHKDYMRATQLVPEEKIFNTRNGIKPERFENVNAWPQKEPFRFVFGSSPDRGLDRAMRVLDRVRQTYPDVTLHVHYGIEHLPKWGHQKLHDELKQMFSERPWVKYHGATQQDALMDSYRRSNYCVQPSDWIETSCISAMELVGSGVYPIFRAVGGVCDTLAPFVEKGMAKLVHSDCITEKEHDFYAEEVIQTIQAKELGHLPLMKAYSWESVAQEWLEEIPKMIEAPKEPHVAAS